jgi:hypothetical protein
MRGRSLKSGQSISTHHPIPHRLITMRGGPGMRSRDACTTLCGACYHADMALSDPERQWPVRLMLVLVFVAIAMISFAAGWLVGAVLTEHVRLI